LSRAKARGQRASCASNSKQLQLCWMLYSLDFNDTIVQTGGIPLTVLADAIDGYIASKRA